MNVSVSNVAGKIGRTGLLLHAWISYIVNSGNGMGALRDFRIWILTTFFPVSMNRLDVFWVSLPCIRWLERYLRPDMKVFEWGSGASTVYFAKRVERVVSVEHDGNWYRKTGKTMSVSGIRNVRRIYRPLNVENPKADGMVLSRTLCRSYAGAIKSFPDGYFDVILVDGKGRVECMSLARKKVKRGGIVILDDAERSQYRPGISLYRGKSWKARRFDGPSPCGIWPVFGRTTVFLRKA